MIEIKSKENIEVNPVRQQMLLALILMLVFPFFAACKSGSPDGDAGANDLGKLSSLPSLQTSHSPDRAYEQPKADSVYLIDYIKKESDFKHHLGLMEQFYQDRNYELAWFRSNQLKPQADKLMQAIERAHQEGLDPENYRVKDLRAMYESFDRLSPSDRRKMEKQQEIDFALTASYFNYASDFYKGATDPHGTASIEWEVKRNKIKLNKALETILKERESTYPYYEFEALHNGYLKLRGALVKFRAMQERGGWPKVDDGGIVRLNDTAEVVVALRERLMPAHQVNIQDSSNYVYDREVEAVVKAFQRQNGLAVDGVVGPQTYKILNVSVDERIDQIILNMERWRWLPKRLVPEGKPNRYVMVNIPAYELRVMEDDEEKMRMKVVVGKTMHSTPIFSHEIQYLIFSPYWNVPNSIVMAEIKPKLQRNRNWLETQNMEMVTTFGPDARRVPVSRVNWYTVNRDNFKYRIRQRPGPSNSLGRVKFMFPNEYAVYLHDTPANHLFDQSERDFSHGCVRVERPADLANYLLQDDPSWDYSRVLQAMNRTTEQRVNIKENVPVYLVYFTAWVEDDGTVHFRDDLYGHDSTLAQEFF